MQAFEITEQLKESRLKEIIEKLSSNASATIYIVEDGENIPLGTLRMSKKLADLKGHTRVDLDTYSSAKDRNDEQREKFESDAERVKQKLCGELGPVVCNTRNMRIDVEKEVDIWIALRFILDFALKTNNHL